MPVAIAAAAVHLLSSPSTAAEHNAVQRLHGRQRSLRTVAGMLLKINSCSRRKHGGRRLHDKGALELAQGLQEGQRAAHTSAPHSRPVTHTSVGKANALCSNFDSNVAVWLSARNSRNSKATDTACGCAFLEHGESSTPHSVTMCALNLTVTLLTMTVPPGRFRVGSDRG